MFLKKRNYLKFPDDSCVKYVDRETLQYSRGIYSVLVWVDYYKINFLKFGRNVDLDSIKMWNTSPPGEPVAIDSEQQKDIYDKIEKYCKSKGYTVRPRTLEDEED